MNEYLKLVNFEWNRFMKMYLILIGVTIILQVTGVIFESKLYIKRAGDVIYGDMVSKEEFLLDYGPMSFESIMNSIWVYGSIGICIVTLIIYVFFIWYRDWFGKNTFIYRLLTIPTARINIYFAKATALFLLVLGLVSLQIILLPIGNRIFQMLVPVDFRMDITTDVIIESGYLTILFPNTFKDFLIHYGTGFIAVLIVFTAILFERSYQLKGILFGGIYCAVALTALFSSMLATAFIGVQYLYPEEQVLLQLMLSVLVMTISILTSRLLLNKKVKV